MTKLNDRTFLRSLREQIVDQLNIDGLTFKVGSIRYEPDGSEAKITLTVASTATGFRDPYRENLEYTSMEYGQEFVSQFEKFRVVGYNPRAKRYPVMAERVSDGKRFKFTRLAVERK